MLYLLHIYRHATMEQNVISAPYLYTCHDGTSSMDVVRVRVRCFVVTGGREWMLCVRVRVTVTVTVRVSVRVRVGGLELLKGWVRGIRVRVRFASLHLFL